MKIAGQTPLSHANIPSEVTSLFRSLWIESLEEALAAASALTEADDSPEKSALEGLARSTSIRQSLSNERITELACAKKGGELGCLVDEETLKEYLRLGRLRQERAAPAGAFEEKLPSVVRLIEKMMPIRDQGQRGTCVAFGTVALREFLLGDNKNDLSEQFLYWACKEMDGYPGPGTYIHTAMSVLAEYGVCRESVWPYNPNRLDDEGQDPPPPGAKEDAQSFKLNAVRTVEPNLVNHYKHILAGEKGRGGMPITFATLVFNSWYMSVETYRTGKITMPLPKEKPVGGHAWCIVGYVDDNEVPGGGYFIVRNSWGVTWAFESPESAGHALMPYAYVEKFAMEAFTGPAETEPDVIEHLQIVPAEYVRILDRDERDMDHKLLKQGTKVLFHPFQPEIFREDNSNNRAEFLRGNRTWTEEARQHVWFPPLLKLPDNIEREAEDLRQAKASFQAAISENMEKAKGKPIPEVKALPFWYTALAWEPRIRDVIEPVDLSKILAEKIIEMSGVPVDLDWPDNWRVWLQGLNDMKVYTLSGVSSTFHVIASFPVRLKFPEPGSVEICPPSQEEIELIREIYRKWSGSQHPRATFKFFTLAAAKEWPKDMSGLSASDHWLIISEFKGGLLSEIRTPVRVTDRLSLRDFTDLLRPETEQQRISRIKENIDKLLGIGYGGHIDVEKIKRELGYRRTAILRSFFALQKSGHYRVYKTTKGKIAIGRESDKTGVPASEAILRQSMLAHLAFIGPAVSVGIWFLKDLILGRSFDILGITAVMPLAYMGEWFNTRIRRWRGGRE